MRFREKTTGWIIPIQKRQGLQVPQNAGKTWYGGMCHLVYDSLTGWPISMRDAVAMTQYSGFPGMLTHRLNAYKDCPAYMPFILPTEDKVVTKQGAPRVPNLD